MRLSLVKGLGLLALLVGGVGCPAPKPPPPPVPKPAPEPPPPPKCNTLKDACVADADTRVVIPDSVDYSFQPPQGWMHANLPDSSMAQASDTGPVIVAGTFPRPTSGRTAKRAEGIKSLAEVIGVVPFKVKAALTLKPPEKMEFGGLPVQLWEVPGAKRGNAGGALVVLAADVADRELLMVGFAPKSDVEGSQAIMKSLQSLAPASKVSDKDAAKPDGEDAGGEGAGT